MYKKIADYGLIGDMYAVALVSKDGSIDYCSMPYIDSPTVFTALLDDEKGGFFRIQPRETFQSEQKYVKDTNILTCTFKTTTAEAYLLDFMPVDALECRNKEHHCVHRCLKVVSGRMSFLLECFPVMQYASELPTMEREGNIFRFRAKKDTATLMIGLESYQITESGKHGIALSFTLEERQEVHFDFFWGEKQPDESEMCSFKETQTFWVDWTHSCIAAKCLFLGEYTEAVNRSLLILKLLTFMQTGAVAAAATTSLPECTGGERNWDYRFTWLRDASFTLKALFIAGHIKESDCFMQWLNRVYRQYGSRNLQPLYSLQGEDKLTEKTLDYLKGYQNSKPVRIGNGAYRQNQWDIYGEVMDTALRISDYIGTIDESMWPFFREICTLAIQHWQKPDDGIWEVRNGPFHFVYSKVMCWVALDRGIKIARRYGFPAPIEIWEKERENIKQDILEKGYDHDLGSFVQHYGSKDLDASLLLLPLMNFLPIHDERIQGTIGACRRKLSSDGFLQRYSGADGLQGQEGAFVLCNFWLVESLALSGKIDEAREILRTTLKASNHLGLFAEEYDTARNELLGNFPQAFSHIGFINAVFAIFHIESSMVRDTAVRTSWIMRMKKLIPYRIVLNKTSKRKREVGKEIAYQLKMTLNNLQGAFFDVGEGRVNYQKLKISQSYSDYLELAERLNYFDPFLLKTDEEKKAFWINIYNILIIHGVIELDIQTSVKEVFRFFSRTGYAMKGFFFTPDDIEHGILRINKPPPGTKIKQFSRFDKRKALCLLKPDPRIHFALVCASGSCPPIKFYEPERINEQLDIAGRSFINRRGMILDRKQNILFLSRILKWYLSDFGKTQRQSVEYALAFADNETKSFVLENLNTLKIKYVPDRKSVV